MRSASIAVVLHALTVWPVGALAQDERCPKGLSNNECAQWEFERADKVLTEAIANKIDAATRMTTRLNIIEAIRQTGQEAHRAWIAYREAECKAHVTANVISAVPQESQKFSCLLSMTQRRIAEVKRL